MREPNGHHPNPESHPPLDCARAREALPFYAAGTLDAGQGLQVHRHLTACADCRAEMAAWTRLAEAVRADAEARLTSQTLPPLRALARPHDANTRSDDAARQRGPHYPNPMKGHRMTTTLTAMPRAAHDRATTPRRRGLLTGAVALLAALLMMSIQFIGRVTPPGQFGASPAAQAGVLQPITPDNVAALAPIHQFGRGVLIDLAWSPDGTTLALATTSGVYRYQPDSGADAASPVERLGEADDAILSISYTPDGASLLLVRLDGGLERWDATTGELLRTYTLSRLVIGAQVSPDGETMLVLACADAAAATTDDCWNGAKTVYVVELATGIIVNQLGDFDHVRFAYSPDGARFALASNTEPDDPVLLQLVGTRGRPGTSVSLGEGIGQHLAFSPDGARLGVLRYLRDRATVTVLDVQDAPGAELARFPIERNVYNFAFTADGEAIRYVTSATHTGLQDYKTRSISAPVQTQRRLDAPLVAAAPAAFNPADEARFAAYDSSGALSVWRVGEDSVHQTALLTEFLGIIDGIALPPRNTDDSLIAIVSGYALEVRDYATGEVVARYASAWGGSIAFNAVAFSADGRLAFAPPSGDDIPLIQWTRESGFLVLPVTQDQIVAQRISGVGFDMDERVLVFGQHQREGRGIWREAEAGDFTFVPLTDRPPHRPLSDVLLSADRDTVAIAVCLDDAESELACPEVALALYDATTGEPVLVVEADYAPSYATRLALSLSDGRGIVAARGCPRTETAETLDELADITCAGGAQGQVRAWDLTDALAGEGVAPTPLFTLPTEDGLLGSALALSQDGRLLATQLSSESVALIDTATGDLLTSVPITRARITSLTFNEVGTLLAVGSQGTVTLYGVAE